MKSSLLALLLLTSVLSSAHSADQPDPLKAARVRVGDPAPEFVVTTVEGRKFSLAETRGKVVVVNFFATWCGPCLKEMPHLESEVWQKFRDRRFAMISLGREHTNDELKPFGQKMKLSFPMAGDTNRLIFDRYAEAYIPRTLLLDGNGRIISQLVGYDPKEFAKFIRRLETELSKLP